MVKTKKQTGLRLDSSFIKSQPKLARMPVFNAAGQSTLKEAQKLFDQKTVQGEVQKLATRRSSLEKVLLGFARGASKSLDSVIREEKRVAEQEVRMNEKYRASLIARRKETKPRRARPGKKDEFLITGQVLHPKTGEPVPGMVVEVTDKDISKHDLLGVDTTDSEGRYEISFRENDFKERGEELPEVVLRVGVDRKIILHITEDVVKAEPGKRVTVDISLPEDQINTIDRVVLRREKLDQRRLNNVNQTMAVERVEHVVLQEMGVAFKDSLGKATVFLEARTAKTAKTKKKSKKISKGKT